MTARGVHAGPLRSSLPTQKKKKKKKKKIIRMLETFKFEKICLAWMPTPDFQMVLSDLLV